MMHIRRMMVSTMLALVCLIGSHGAFADAGEALLEMLQQR